MTDFIFIRHGQSQANADKEIATAKSPLTKQGIQQAIKTANEITDLGVKQIVCSPLKRAQQTAEIIAGELGIEIQNILVIDELTERGLGDLKGRPKQHDSDYYYTVDNQLSVETRIDTLRRMSKCIDKIKRLSEKGKVLAIGHAISGYFLIEASRGKTVLSELEPASEISNADYLVVSF